MLGHLRDRIQNVQQDLSNSLRESLQISAATKAEVRAKVLGIAATGKLLDPSAILTTTPAASVVAATTSNRLNLSAGTELIEYYHSRWQQLRDSSRRNAECANRVTNEVTTISSDIARLRSAGNDLAAGMADIGEIENTISLIEADIRQTATLFGALEEVITQMNRHVTRMDYEAKRADSNARVATFADSRADDLRSLESRLIERAEDRLRRAAEREAALMRERQAVFQQAFEEELRAYKEKSATINTTVTSNKMANEVDDQNADRFSRSRSKAYFADISDNNGDDEDEDEDETTEDEEEHAHSGRRAGKSVKSKKLADVTLEFAKADVDALEKFLDSDPDDDDDDGDGDNDKDDKNNMDKKVESKEAIMK